jgi:hypothetical protein
VLWSVPASTSGLNRMANLFHDHNFLLLYN